MKQVITLAIVVILGLTAGVLVAVFGLNGGNATSEIVLGSFTVRTADAAAQPRLTREAAETIAGAAAAERLTGTISTLALKSGRSLRAEDLALAGSAFAPAAVEVSSSVSTFRYRSSRPADLWVFIYRADGIEMPDWGIADGVVEVVIDDLTGKVESADVLRYNPHAEP